MRFSSFSSFMVSRLANPKYALEISGVVEFYGILDGLETNLEKGVEFAQVWVSVAFNLFHFFGWTLQHSKKINVSQASSHSEALQSPFNKNISQMNLRFLLIFSSLHHICVPKTHPNAQSTPPMKAIFQYHHLGLCWPFIMTSWKFHNEKTSTHHGYMHKRHLDDLKPLQKNGTFWESDSSTWLYVFCGKSLHPFFSRHLFFSPCPLERFSNVGKNAGKQKTWHRTKAE